MVIGLKYTDKSSQKVHLIDSSVELPPNDTHTHHHHETLSSPSGTSSDRELLDSFSNRSSTVLDHPFDDHHYYYQKHTSLNLTNTTPNTPTTTTANPTNHSNNSGSNLNSPSRNLPSSSTATTTVQPFILSNGIGLQSPNDNMPSSATSSLPGSTAGYNSSFKFASAMNDPMEAEELSPEDSHQVEINNWEVNSKATKKWFLGVRRKRFPSNYISTTKYTWWNFIVLNLIYQFCKIGNIYFIITMIFALIPGVSPITPITAVLPVIFIIGVNMIREGGEDFLRYLNDRKINKMTTNVLRRNNILTTNNGNDTSNNGKIEQIYTCDIKVGDIVKVEEDCSFPADMLLISSNFPDGSCKIETANLDGETNLKSRYSPKGLSVYNSISMLNILKGSINCQLPSEQLYKFKGSLKIDGMNEIPLSHQNLLLKGSILRATQFVYGIVIYSGPDTKIMKNMQKGKVKFSFVNQMLNYAVGILFTIQIASCLLFAGLGGYYEFTQAKTKATYTGEPTPVGISDTGFVISSFLTYFILLSLMIPVSLFVSLEFVKMIQAWFITMDNKMAIYDKDPHDSEKSIFINSVSISSDLNADLSQVDIIFSDKTGTLTENSMVFKKCCIGFNYIHDDYVSKGQLSTTLNNLLIDYTSNNGNTTNNGNNNQKDLKTFELLNTLLLLSLCHNVSVREKLNVKTKMKNSFLEGESIDEVALVLGAQNNGFKLKFYSEKLTIIEIFGKEYSFERCAEIPFTADRKRMSTIFLIPNEFLNDFPIYRKYANQYIPNMESTNGIYVCFTKGADSFLFPFVKSPENEKDKKILEENILKFAVDGLRTLLLAFKFIEFNEFNTWLTRYNNSKSNMSRKRKRLIEECEIELESKLLIVGATAIEDCLQPKVPETIKFLLDAGLQLWLLTGDKRETAINIAQMSNFLSKESQIYSLNGEDGTIHDEITCAKLISNHIQQIESNSSLDNALILDGHSFSYCMDSNCVKLFIELVKKCKTVICCRATPKQKSQLVDLAKKKLGKNGLAIGDGANDVPMIQKAKIGVGVMGKEGSQAKLASDYAIPKFYMLKRLLVTHGRYSFKRSAQFIQYSFYKNVVISFVQIFYAFYTMSSGQTIADSYVLTFYNLVFTLLNPFVFGLFEKDINEDLLEDPEIGPKLYAQLRTDNIFNWFTFVKWILGGIIHATIIFYFAIYGTGSSILTDGKDDGLWSLSTLICSSVFIVVNLKCYFEMEYITIMHHICMIISFISYYGFQFGYAGIEFVSTSANFTYYVWYVVVQSPKFWIVHLLCVIVPLAFDMIFYGIKYWAFPDYYQQLKMGKMNCLNQGVMNKETELMSTVDSTPRIPSEKTLLMDV